MGKIKDKEETMQNPIKSCFSMVSKWFKTPLVRNAIIISGIFALIIHILYSIPAPFEFLVHKWEAGDILTYVSTIALSLLAVWQNQKFKEESDKSQALMDKQNTEAQERLERISAEANEISIITRIVDSDTQYIMHLEKTGLEFLDAAQTGMLMNVIRNAVEEENDNAVSKAHSLITYRYTLLLSAYFSGMRAKESDVSKVINAFEKLHSETSSVFKNYYSTRKYDLNFVDQHLKLYQAALRELNDYLDVRRQLLHRVLAEKLTLEEIRKMYEPYRKVQ